MKIYSIKNEKIGLFNRPIYCESEREALSYIQNVLMSDADRALVGLRDSLSLYYLGSIDFENGSIIPSGDGPFFICTLAEIFDTVPSGSVPNMDKVEQNHIDIINMRAILDDVSAKLESISKDMTVVKSCNVISKQMRYKK